MKLGNFVGLWVGVIFSLSIIFSPLASAELVKFKEGKSSFSLPVYLPYEKFEATWDGPSLNGLAEGEGMVKYNIEYEDKTKYEAEGKMTMKQGLLQGRGVLKFSNGDRFDIIFADGEPKSGLVMRADGRKYEGEFYHDLANGKGIFTAADGSSYDGYFQMNKPHGYGVEKDKNGTIIYQGEWLNGFHADDPAAQRTLTGFLAMPWKSERKVVEETLNKRPGTEFVSVPLLGKFYGYGAPLANPQKGRYYSVTGKFNNETAELIVWFFDDKLAGGRASLFNSEQEIMSKFDETKKSLISKYGQPNSEKGNGTATVASWSCVNNDRIDLYIRKLGYENNAAMTPEKKKPFNLTIDYVNSDLMNKINPQQAAPTNSDF